MRGGSEYPVVFSDDAGNVHAAVRRFDGGIVLDQDRGVAVDFAVCVNAHFSDNAEAAIVLRLGVCVSLTVHAQADIAAGNQFAFFSDHQAVDLVHMVFTLHGS